MSAKRIHRKIERTAEQQRELENIREQLQRERPGLEDLLAKDDAEEAVSQGEYLDLRTMLPALKKHREHRGLSLADAATRSGMDRAAIAASKTAFTRIPPSTRYIATLKRSARKSASVSTFRRRLPIHELLRESGCIVAA